MLKRVSISMMAVLRSLDILACTLWLAPLYIVGLADRPTGRMMISSYVGKAASNGHRWAIVVASVIDRAAMILGDKPDHCWRAYLAYRGLDGTATFHAILT